MSEVLLKNKLNDNGFRHGYWDVLWDNGKPWFSGHYINGKKQGYWKYHYINGDLLSNGNYLNDKRNGYWKTYSNDGITVECQFYYL